jgi:hypothetical protein
MVALLVAVWRVTVIGLVDDAPLGLMVGAETCGAVKYLARK